jgi:hypothetical protein
LLDAGLVLGGSTGILQFSQQGEQRSIVQHQECGTVTPLASSGLEAKED